MSYKFSSSLISGFKSDTTLSGIGRHFCFLLRSFPKYKGPKIREHAEKDLKLLFFGLPFESGARDHTAKICFGIHRLARTAFLLAKG